MVSNIIDFVLRFSIGFLIAQLTFMLFGLSFLSGIAAILTTLILFQLIGRDKDDNEGDAK